MSTNKNNYPAMRYIKFTTNTKKKYEELLKIIKDINSCDYYISCEICCENSKKFRMFAHFTSSYKLCKGIIKLKVDAKNCIKSYEKVINKIKSNTVLAEWGKCPIQENKSNEKSNNFNGNEININQETESMEKLFETSSDEINCNEYEPRIKGGIDEIKENSEDSNDNKYENSKEFKKNNNESTFEGRKTVGELKKITNPDELYYNKYYAWSKIHEEMNVNMDVEDPPKNIEVYYIFDPSGAERISKVKEIIRNNKDKYGTTYNDVKFKYNHWIGVGYNCKIALYDNFRDTDMDVIEFNDFIDSERHILETKNEQMVNNYELIIITSIYSPYHIYENSNVYRRQWLKYIKIIDMRATKDD